MVGARDVRWMRHLHRLAHFDQSRAEIIPGLLATGSCAVILGRFRDTEKLLPNLVCMLVKETMKDDGVCVIIGKSKPIITVFALVVVLLRMFAISHRMKCA